MEIEILNPTRLQTWCQRIGIAAEPAAALTALAETIVRDPALCQIFAETHHKTAMQGEWYRDWGTPPFDPLVTEKLGRQDTLFYLLAYMAAIPYAEKEYLRRGIDTRILDATLYDIPFYLNQQSEIRGYWTYEHLMWIWRHLECKLFRLGRLQYMLVPYEGHATAFRNNTTGDVVLLCGSSIPLRADGHAQGAGRRDDNFDPASVPDTWYAVYEETDAGWRGHPISPYGYTQSEPVFLSRSEWDCILTPGDTVLDLHIPRGKDMTQDDLRASFRQAFDFFAHYFPERPFKACFCHTWFFTPQLQSLLPPTSSIVRFQREFYLYPNAGGPGFLWSFVFGDKYPDAASAPRDTFLRRAVLDWLAEGKELFDMPGLMFHTPEEWGQQPYMSRADARTQ